MFLQEKRTLQYIPGRLYRLPPSKKPSFLREKRINDRPVSFAKLDKFIKERRRNLRFFLDATREVAASERLPDDDVDMGGVDGVVEGGSVDDGLVMSPEENLALSDDEEVFSDYNENSDSE